VLLLLQVATIPLLKHKADDDALYRQQQQQAWEAVQYVNRPSTSHPTAESAASHRPSRPASVSAHPSASGSSGAQAGALFGGTDGFKWGGPTSGLDESLLLPSCAPAPPRPHSSVGHASVAGGGATADAAASARKPSPLGSPVPQQVRVVLANLLHQPAINHVGAGLTPFQRPLLPKSGSAGDHKEAVMQRDLPFAPLF
jgi:hypothetical protein